MKKIEFFFDYLSPYSYLAWTRLRDDVDTLAKYGELILTPVILSQVIHAYDTKGPAEITPKRDYLMKDCLRKAAKNNISFTIPKQLPFNSLDALRLSQSLCVRTSQIPFVDACYRYAWEQGEDLGDDEAFALYCQEKGFIIKNLLETAPMKELRRNIKMQVKRAHSLGVFGLPTFLIYEEGDEENHELFWGHDSFDNVLSYLRGEDHFDHEKYGDYLKRF
jgi:2-hydroxychromene-2-carboxylate isomerase